MIHDAERVKFGLVEKSPRFYIGNDPIKSSLEL